MSTHNFSRSFYVMGSCFANNFFQNGSAFRLLTNTSYVILRLDRGIHLSQYLGRPVLSSSKNVCKALHRDKASFCNIHCHSSRARRGRDGVTSSPLMGED